MLNSISWQWISGTDLQSRMLYKILSLRQDVFIVEQNCPYLDTDGQDFDCHHVLGLSSDDDLIAYARVFPPVDKGDATSKVYIGRVIVKKSYRGFQIGEKLMLQSEKFALDEYMSSNHKNYDFALHAQAHLQKFYGRLGYTPKGDIFDEDGIPHILMIK